MPNELSDEELEAQALSELDGKDNGSTDDNNTDDNYADNDDSNIEEPEETETAPDNEMPSDEANETNEVYKEPSEADDADQQNVDDEEVPYGFKLNKPIPIKARGMQIDINSEKELVELAHKGFDYFKKTQELAKWRKDIDVIEDGQLSIEELQLLADIKSGNKEAVSAMMNKYGIDPIAVEPEDANQYRQTQRFSDNYEVENIVDSIKSDPQHLEHFQRVSSALPDEFVDEIASDATKLMHFSDHVKRGLADKVIPEAMKAQVMYGGRFMDHYTRIGQQMAMQEEQVPKQTEQTPNVEQRQMTDRERELRRKATTPKSGSRKVSFKADAESIWDLSDEDFNALSGDDFK